MKKFFTAFMAFIIFQSGLFGFANNSALDKEEPANPATDFEYIVEENGEVTVKRYIGESNRVIIPDTIEGNPVTKISGIAFTLYFDHQKNDYDVVSDRITYVKIPKFVKELYSLSFANCVALETIVLPDGIEKLGSCTFTGCTNLTNVILPDSITEIGADVFRDCKSLTQIKLPPGLKEIAGGMFWGTGLEAIEIPEGVESIECNAFVGTNIKEVTLPSSMKVLYSYAFLGCNKLTDIKLNEGLESIGLAAFEDSLIEELVIPATVNELSLHTFQKMEKLKAVYFEGDAPEMLDGDMGYEPVETDYTVYYREGAEGFTSPEWCGHKTEIWK